jgi:hypothetical protein
MVVFVKIKINSFMIEKLVKIRAVPKSLQLKNGHNFKRKVYQPKAPAFFTIEKFTSRI